VSLLLTCATSPLGRKAIAALAIALAILALLAEVRHSGVKLQQERDAKATAARQAQVHQINTQTATIAAKAGSDAATSQTQIVYRTKTIVEHVHDAIPPASDSLLPGGFGLLYDASLGLVPYDPAMSAGALQKGPGIRASDALASTIIPNNGKCAAIADQLNRLVDYDAAVSVKVNGR